MMNMFYIVFFGSALLNCLSIPESMDLNPELTAEYCRWNQCFAITLSHQSECYSNDSPIPCTPGIRTTENNCPNNAEDFCGQDAQYLDPPRTFENVYYDNGGSEERSIVDSRSGLEWSTTKTSSPRETWSRAFDYCDELVFAGFNDWRLPNIIELETLLDNSKIGDDRGRNRIDSRFFYDTGPWGRYWSSTEVTNVDSMGQEKQMYVLTFDEGTQSPADVTKDYFIRCVRWRVAPLVYSVRAEDRFLVSGNADQGEVVTDMVTKLIWQRDRTENSKTWQEAMQICEKLNHAGFSDWRMPNRKELVSLINFSGVFSFPDMPQPRWSSTTHLENNNSVTTATVVSFKNAPWIVYNQDKTTTASTRCVRGGQ